MKIQLLLFIVSRETIIYDKDYYDTSCVISETLLKTSYILRIKNIIRIKKNHVVSRETTLKLTNRMILIGSKTPKMRQKCFSSVKRTSKD